MFTNFLINLDTAATDDASAAQGLFAPTSLITLGMLVVVVVVFYFMVIRPQKKQDREAAAMRNSLRIGDEVTTIGGIIGKIVSIKDPTCVIETGRDGARIRILKSAIKTVDVPAAATMAPTEETPAEDGAQEADQPHETVVNGKPEKKEKKKKEK